MRLFTQIYLGFVAIAVSCVASVAVLAVAMSDGRWEADTQQLGQVWAAGLPDDPAQRQAELENLSRAMAHSVVLWDADGTVLSAVGELPYGEAGRFRESKQRGVRIALADGGMLGLGSVPSWRRHLTFFGALLLVALVVAAGSWPLARRITTRLELLRRGAQRWGAGDLDARVDLQGADEVADVARSFNQAAEKVQAVVVAQQRVLGSVSHELRSPLARLRMHLELLDGENAEAIEEVEELDRTVGELLESSRMAALDGPAEPVAVSLGELAAEVRVEAQITGELVVQGDRRLLRRMVRNLLDNAAKYGKPPVRVVLDGSTMSVIDGGEPLPAEQRESVFEPFYRAPGHSETVHGGVGLGLALVRQIAEFHGATVHYEDEGGATAFRVRFSLK